MKKTAYKGPRYRVVQTQHGAEVVDEARGGLNVAWCGDVTLATSGGVWSSKGVTSARLIAKALNASVGVA